MLSVKLLEAVILSMTKNGAVRFEGDWFVFSYQGNTMHHIHFFCKGSEEVILSGKDLKQVVASAAKWYEERTTIPIITPPPRHTIPYFGNVP